MVNSHKPHSNNIFFIYTKIKHHRRNNEDFNKLKEKVKVRLRGRKRGRRKVEDIICSYKISIVNLSLQHALNKSLQEKQKKKKKSIKSRKTMFRKENENNKSKKQLRE